MVFDELVIEFKRRNITVIPVDTPRQACQQVLSLIPLHASVGFSGSVTLESIGILDKLRNGAYTLFDRAKAARGTKEYLEIGKRAQHADYFLAGSNAITEQGEIVNIDKTGNRVSSLVYGSEHVIVVVGKNKIVKDYDAAIRRIKSIAAPLNARRLGAKTPCAATGVCADCSSPDRLCCSTVSIGWQSDPKRMNIILVNEDLGY